MVSRLCIFFLLALQLLAADVVLPPKVTVSFNQETLYDSKEIEGTVTIIHDDTQEIDERSFLVQNHPLKVEKIVSKDSNVPEGLIVSRYQFTLPPEKPGLHLFPSVSVKVGAFTMTSPQASFEVRKRRGKESLSLRVGIHERPPYYPGETLSFEYAISFKDPIELVKEELPLFSLEGFRNIGAPKVESFSENGGTVQLITQKALSLTSGTFSVKPSTMEGYVYAVNAFGERTRISELLHAEAPGFRFTIDPFPQVGKPLSFTGAIGVFTWKAHLLGPTSVVIGDRLHVELMVSGSGDLDTVSLPDISKQAGFTNIFRISDVPSPGTLSQQGKRFVIEMRPLTEEVSCVPSIEFSSFDPVTKRYLVTSTEPLPITVRSQVKKETTLPPPQKEAVFQEKVDLIEIAGNIPLEKRDFHSSEIPPSHVLYIAFSLLAAFGCELVLHRSFMQGEMKIIHSRDLFYQAIRSKHNPALSSSLIEKALLLKLYEMRYVEKAMIVPEDLSEDGLQGEIKHFLLAIDKKRFSGLALDTEIQEIIKEGSELFHRLAITRSRVR